MTDEELTYLEEAYVAHSLTGVMAQNRPETISDKHVWSIGEQKI